MNIGRLIIDNLDSDGVTSIIESTTYGKVGLCANVISDAMQRARFMTFGGQAYCFNGEIYVPVEDLRYHILSVIRSMDSDGKLTAKSQTIISVCLNSVSGSRLNIDSNLICFRNAVLNIATEEVLPFSPDHHIVTQLEYDYIPGATPVLWTKFLSEVLEDAESVSLLQEFLGLIFVDRKKIKIETMLFLLGKGANGKSVVFDTVIGVLGSSNVRNYEISALTNSSDRGKNLMDVNGKLLNYCSEISSRSFSSSSFKSLISGEPQQARPIYGDPAKVENIPLMMANANTMPTYKDTSNGVFRRIVILPFSKTIPEEKQDKLLSSKMRAEYPAILNWILDGRRRVEGKGFILHQGKSVKTALNEYRQENNTVYQFIDASAYSHQGLGYSTMYAKDLYDAYTAYCRQSNVEYETQTNFGRTMSVMGFEKGRLSTGIVYKLYKQ